jgi:hypothetical protein
MAGAVVWHSRRYPLEGGGHVGGGEFITLATRRDDREGWRGGWRPGTWGVRIRVLYT